MELQQVRYFVALCGTLNFTRAAEQCQVSQPALTRAIQKLEEELGGPLFQRERNLTQLTELGRLMRPLLEQTLATADAAKASASRFQKNELASLRIALLASIPAADAVPAIAEVVRRIPAVQVGLSTSQAQAPLVDALLQGDVDAAFLVDDGALPERLKAWRLYSESFVLALPPGHRLADMAAIPVAALARQPLVERRDSPAAAALAELCRQRGAELGTRHVADADGHLLDLAAASLGPALLPERAAVPPPLVKRPLADAELSRTVALAVVNGRRFSAALDAFVRLIRARDFGALG